MFAGVSPKFHLYIIVIEFLIQVWRWHEFCQSCFGEWYTSKIFTLYSLFLGAGTILSYHEENVVFWNVIIILLGTCFWSWKKAQNQSQHNICWYILAFCFIYYYYQYFSENTTEYLLTANAFYLELHSIAYFVSLLGIIIWLKLLFVNFHFASLEVTTLILISFLYSGPLRSRAAKAIGFIDMMIDYSSANAPLQKELSAGKISINSFVRDPISPYHHWFMLKCYFFLYDETEEVGNAAAFLASPLASAITGAVIYVDNGLNAMGVGVDSPIFKDLDIPTDKH